VRNLRNPEDGEDTFFEMSVLTIDTWYEIPEDFYDSCSYFQRSKWTSVGQPGPEQKLLLWHPLNVYHIHNTRIHLLTILEH
jgi:hypothetical protein